MNSPLEETVAAVVAEVKPKKTRKPKKVELVIEEIKSEPEPVPEPLPEPEPVPEPLPPVPEEPVVVCESCSEEEVIPFTDEEMDIYRRVCAFKRKQLRLRKVAFATV